MASTRSRLYPATTRPRKTEREPSAQAQVRQQERQVPRVPPLVGEREPPALPQVRQQERLQAPRVHEQGRPPATIRPELAPEKRALLEQPPQAAIAPPQGRRHSRHDPPGQRTTQHRRPHRARSSGGSADVAHQRGGHRVVVRGAAVALSTLEGKRSILNRLPLLSLS